MPAETHVERGELDRRQVFELIRDRLADILEIEPSGISEGTSFGDDLNADSLALIELVEALEEELAERTVGFRIDDEDLEDLKTVRDAVLGLVVTDHIFRTYPTLPEGELAKVRAAVVNAGALADLAAELDLGRALLLGKGEDASGGREKPSILADAMEAVIGAVYLDGGWDAAAELVLHLLEDRIEEAAAGPGGQDFKTRLQELAARRFDQL